MLWANFLVLLLMALPCKAKGSGAVQIGKTILQLFNGPEALGAEKHQACE